MKTPKIMIGIPMLGTVTAEFFKSILMIKTNGNTQIALEVNSLTHVARNNLAAKALEQECDYIVMVDSDMTFEPDAILKLVQDAEEGQLDLVAALSFRRQYPTAPIICKSVTWERDMETGQITHGSEAMLDYPKDSLFEIGGAGFGMVCVRCETIKEVAGKFAMPPFDPMPALGEDYSFCWRMGQLGKKLYCDSRIKLGHVGATIFDEGVWERQQKKTGV